MYYSLDELQLFFGIADAQRWQQIAERVVVPVGGASGQAHDHGALDCGARVGCCLQLVPVQPVADVVLETEV